MSILGDADIAFVKAAILQDDTAISSGLNLQTAAAKRNKQNNNDGAE